MLKPLVPMFHFDPSVRLMDIAQKQVPAKPKPIVLVDTRAVEDGSNSRDIFRLRFQLWLRGVVPSVLGTTFRL